MSTTRSAPVQADPILDQSRQPLYRFGALALLDPQAGAWKRIADPASQTCVQAAAELIRDESAEPIPLGLGEFSVETLDPAEVFAKLPDSAEGLNAEYEQIFGLVASGSCPPLETEYIESKQTFKRSHHLADVAGFYNAFGLERTPDHPERQDHIVLELEFMACLIALERAAAEAGETERVEICRAAEKRFLEEHLSWWVPAFARLLSKERPDGFYAAVGRLLCAFLPTERRRLGVEPPQKPAVPSRMERPEECDGCLLQT